MANETIRTAAKRSGVTLWAVADRLNISEPTMTRKMRKELSDGEQETILAIISELAVMEAAIDGVHQHQGSQ